MAPNLNSKSNKLSEQTKFEKKVKKQLLEFRKFVEKNCKNVGNNFSQEARNIHYDKKTSKGIYGKATNDEVKSLNEEGIETQIIPWIKDKDN